MNVFSRHDLREVAVGAVSDRCSSYMEDLQLFVRQVAAMSHHRLSNITVTFVITSSCLYMPQYMLLAV